ncbi:SLC13 family permease [Thalassoroseus pseudoceratinae]|uniref:SLC13 family permease n=1 Tax=Thalassoroseus pseudoceratinae TaxID=2713176 RepID=UPI0014228EEC|nr:SLC13 family permease [Thalassoroseus pseudoceratinae]
MASTSDINESTDSRLPLFGRILGFLLFGLVWSLPADTWELSRPAQNLAAVSVLMAVFWLTQALPMSATALVPLAMFPLLGIQSATLVSKSYIDRNIFLYFGGFIIAMGIERWGLHRRMALHIVRRIGTSSARIVLGFMLATAFLSMWISNTASSLLMLPIALALVNSLGDLPAENEDAAKTRDQAINRLVVVLLLGVAYSASIGGFTSLVGTPTNLTFTQIFERRFPEAPDIAAGQWMIAVVPVGVVMLAICWGILTFRLPSIQMPDQGGANYFDDRLRKLGPPTRAEKSMFLIFLATALLWLFRTDLSFAGTTLVPGWGNWVETTFQTAEIHDSTVALAMALLMFLIPARRNENGRTEHLMDWETVENMPWGILILIGGGYALAGAFQSTGLSEDIGRIFASQLAGQSAWLIVGGTCLLLTFLTELTSNTATVATLMPVLAATAVAINIDPLLIMIPATISASCAFMLPIATPPNAIVFSSGRISMRQMARYGILLNLVGVVVITAFMFWIIGPQFNVKSDSLPEWATPSASELSTEKP